MGTQPISFEPLNQVCSHVSEMFDYTDFQQVFPAGSALPYDRELLSEIEGSRKAFDGQLFIDRVIKALGFSKGKSYPPKTDNALRQLHHQICEASMALHYKLSILYYILLDFDRKSTRAVVSEDFASNSGLPKSYQILMKGLWQLDQQEFEDALEYIAYPSLIPDFADDIITALVRNGEEQLALSYYYTVQPILSTSTALELLFEAMARNDATEALFFSRTQPEYIRETLFQRLVSLALGDNQNAGVEDAAFLPFTAEEEAWFEEFLLHGDGKSIKKSKDTLLVRKIADNRFDEIKEMRGNSGSWGPILEGIRQGTDGQ